MKRRRGWWKGWREQRVKKAKNKIMRLVNKKTGDQNEIGFLLSSTIVGRLGTIGANGPMIKPVNFVYLNGAIYFHSAKVGEKIDHIKNDPRVCFQVEADLEYQPAVSAPCKASYNYSSVIATGDAVFVDDGEELLSALSALMIKYQPAGGYRPVTLEMADNVSVIRIDIDNVNVKVTSEKNAG